MSFWDLGATSVLSGIGGLVNNIFGQSNMKKQMQFQHDEAEIARQFNAGEAEKQRQYNSQEAEIARQFNASEAEKQRAYNTEMVNQQNQYNSPAAMMQRLQAAGLNPNLVYGELGNASVGVGSAGAASAGAASSGAASYGGSFGTSLPSFTNAAKDMAEVELLKAQADKANSERDLTNKEVEWYDQIKSGELKLLGVNFSLGEATKNLTEQQIVNLAKQVEVFNSQMELLKSQCANLDEDSKKKVQETISLMLDNKLKDANFDNAVKRFAAETHIASEQAKTIFSLLCSQIALNVSGSSLNNQFVEESNKRIEKLGAEVGLLHNQSAYVGASTANVEANTGLLNLQLFDEHSKDRFKRGDIGSVINGGVSTLGDYLRGLLGGIISL